MNVIENGFNVICLGVIMNVLMFLLEEREVFMVIISVGVAVEVANGKEGVEKVVITIVFHLQVHHIFLLYQLAHPFESQQIKYYLDSLNSI